MRIFVLSGQGGWLTSPGMLATAKALEPYGEVSTHVWNDWGVLPGVTTANHLGKRVAVIGYSLGANQLGWLDDHIRFKIALGVAIDPSKQSPLVHRNGDGEYVQVVQNYERLVCFYHAGAWLLGGSKYEGDGVENISVHGTHMTFQFDPNIRSTILKEVSAL
jgi:hypothetical protein